MSRYEKLKKKLEDHKCPECHGSGWCDDAEPGDMFFHTWECTECNGTGLIKKRK